VKIRNFLFVNFGIILLAVEIHFFKTPNKFALGGTSGLSVILVKYFPNLSVGSLMLILNILLLILGYLVLGKKFTANTIYGSVVVSLLVELLDLICPLKGTLTNQKFMELIYSVFLPGLGNAIMFNFNSTTGGIDVLVMIINKIFKIKVSIAMLIIDFIMALSAGLTFGVEVGLFCILGVVLKSFVLDSFMESLNISKTIVIISKHSDEIKKFICNKINRSATIHNAHGAFTGENFEVITTILSRREAIILQRFIKTADKNAFIIITNSSRIIGNGFEQFD
jgi:uncharacterized membrane-anchored protein YitT (DUF2179 family)